MYWSIAVPLSRRATKDAVAVSSIPLVSTSDRSEKRDATLVVVLAVTLLLWSSAFVGIRYAVKDYPPGSLALLRFLIASALLGGYVFLTKPRSSGNAASLKDWGAFFALGATGVFGYHVALNFGEQTVSAGAANGPTLDKGAVLVLLAAVVQAFYFALQKPMLHRFGALELTTRCIWNSTRSMTDYRFIPLREQSLAAGYEPGLTHLERELSPFRIRRGMSDLLVEQTTGLVPSQVLDLGIDEETIGTRRPRLLRNEKEARLVRARARDSGNVSSGDALYADHTKEERAMEGLVEIDFER